MIKKAFAFVLLMACCFLAPSAMCEINGNAIPDANAHQLYYDSLSKLTPSLLTDTLANNVGLSSDDITATAGVLATFKTQNASAIQTYNNSVAGQGDNHTAFPVLINQQSLITTNAQSSLQSNVSAQGYAALEAAITAQKANMALADPNNDMPMGNPNCTGMTPTYTSTYTQTTTIVSWSPLHVKVTFTGNLTGTTYAQGSGCASISHNGTVSMAIGTKTASQTQYGTVTTYMNVQKSVTLDSATDSCVLGRGCKDTSDIGVYCSFILHNIFDWNKLVDWEFANTFVQFNGTITGCHTGASGVTWCNYGVGNWCTAAPPDFNMDGQNVNDSHRSWYWSTAALCFTTNVDGSGNGHQPWTCSYGAAYGLSNGAGTLPPQSCTYHP